jgi:hypothetical protein
MSKMGKVLDILNIVKNRASIQIFRMQEILRYSLLILTINYANAKILLFVLNSDKLDTLYLIVKPESYETG